MFWFGEAVGVQTISAVIVSTLHQSTVEEEHMNYLIIKQQ